MTPDLAVGITFVVVGIVLAWRTPRSYWPRRDESGE